MFNKDPIPGSYKNKVSGVHMKKDVQDFYKESHKTLPKNNKDLNQWRSYVNDYKVQS